MEGWLGGCGSVSSLWGVLLWLGGCRAMAECSSSVCGASLASRGPELMTVSEVWGGAASPSGLYMRIYLKSYSSDVEIFSHLI